MSISKQGLDELNRSAAAALEAFEPMRKLVLEAAKSKNSQALTHVDSNRFNQAMSSCSSLVSLQRAIADGTIKYATAPKMRLYQQEVTFLNNGRSINSDRMLREAIADSFKNQFSDIFGELSKDRVVVGVFPGARPLMAYHGFCMFVEDTPQVRRYLRYVNKVSSPFVDYHCTPTVLSVESFLAKRRPAESCEMNRYQTGSHLSTTFVSYFPDSCVDMVTSVYYQELRAAIDRLATAGANHLHVTHVISELIRVAHDRSMSSILGDALQGTSRGVPLARRAEVFAHVLACRSGGVILERYAREILKAYLGTLYRDSQNSMQVDFIETFDKLKKGGNSFKETPFYKAMVVRETNAPNVKKFLTVSLRYDVQFPAAGKFGVAPPKFFSRSLYDKTSDTMISFLKKNMGFDISPYLIKQTGSTAANSRIQNIRNSFGKKFDNMDQWDERSVGLFIGGNNPIHSCEDSLKTLRQSIQVLNSLMRKNIWTTLAQ